MFNPNMANREVCDLLFCDIKTKKPFLNFDFANVSTTDLQASRVFAKGGQGAPNRVGFDGERNGTLKIDTQITPMKLYAMLSGTDIITTAKFVKREVLTSSSKSLTLTDTPVAGSVHVFASDDDCGASIQVTVSAKQVTLPSEGVDGEFIAYYLVSKETGAQTIKFTAKNFPKAFTVYGETPWKTEDDEIVAMKLVYYKVQPQANFSLAFSNTGDPSTVSITCDILQDSNGDIYDMSIIEDAA